MPEGKEMVTVDHILTNYVGVRKEYLRLEQKTKDKLLTEFMKIAPVRHKENPLEPDSIDIFLCDQSPESIKKMGEKSMSDNDWLEVIADCERFYVKASRNIIGPEFIPHRSKFTELADHYGYELNWYDSSFYLYKSGLRHVIKILFDRHTLTLRCVVYDQEDEEVRKLTTLLTAMKEMIIKENEQHRCYRMIFATGVYNVEVDLSNEIITPDELDMLV